MDVGGQRLEKRCWVGGMGTGAGSVFAGEGQRTRLDIAIDGRVFWGIAESACNALQDGLPGATGTDTDLAISREEGLVAGAGCPLGPTGGRRKGWRFTAELGEELTSEVCLYAEKGEEAETKGRVGLRQGGVSRVVSELERALPG
jgi:hypothetical protein